MWGMVDRVGDEQDTGTLWERRLQSQSAGFLLGSDFSAESGRMVRSWLGRV